jgi:hypothetical protein
MMTISRGEKVQGRASPQSRAIVKVRSPVVLGPCNLHGGKALNRIIGDTGPTSFLAGTPCHRTYMPTPWSPAFMICVQISVV